MKRVHREPNESRERAAWLMRRADQVSLRMSGRPTGPDVWSTRVAFAVARDELAAREAAAGARQAI